MTHEYAGHYGSKHPEGTAYDPALATALSERATDGKVSCVAAFDVVDAFEVGPAEVGTTADLLEYRIVKCQLGLFGYSPEKRIVKPAERIGDELRARVLAAAAGGRISCAACWEIADDLDLPKLSVSGACEGLGLKVDECQLGAF